MPFHILLTDRKAGFSLKVSAILDSRQGDLSPPHGTFKGGRPHTMKHQAIGKVALMLSVFFIVAASAEARPVRYDDIFALASVVSQSGRPAVDLRLRSLNQQSSGTTQQTASATNSGNSQDQKSTPAPDTTSAPAPSTRIASLTGTEIAPPQTGQQTNVETVELGEVQGTICDCGPIRIPGGGFPKWPLLGLGAIPFFFIHGCDTAPCEQTTPTPTPPPTTPTPTPTPEPATIFLFGTGLLAVGAGARKRHARNSKNEDAREVRES
jgi:hypothetical protein